MEHKSHVERVMGEMSVGRSGSWALRFDADEILEVREYMDPQLVTEIFGADENSTPSDG